MLAFAQTKSSSSSLAKPNSPQYRAVEWLAQDKNDNGSNWSGYELLQRYVLRVLYHSTNGEKWSNSAPSTWFGASSVCDWGSTDAQCNGNGQQVDYIDLWRNNLQGTIPDELGLLTALTYLDLSLNRRLASTMIPSQLGELTALTFLDLSFNRLASMIPSQLGQLTALTELWLYGNQLTGTLPSQLGHLTALKVLWLDYDQLTGTLPSQLGQLTALTELWLYDNQLTGTLPSQLGQLTALTLLHLSSNQLTGTLPSQLGQLTALRHFSLSNNQLTGTIPLTLTQLTNLNWLYLYNNNLTGQVPSGFCDKTKFLDWRKDGADGNILGTDCMSKVQCDCCDQCYDESGNWFCWINKNNKEGFFELC